MYSYLLLSMLAGAFAAPAPAPEPVAFPNFSFQGGNTSLSNLARRSTNFNQDYVAGGANVQYSPNTGTGTFTVSYNTQADFVVGLGWQPGDSKYAYSSYLKAAGALIPVNLIRLFAIIFAVTDSILFSPAQSPTVDHSAPQG